MEPRLLPEPFDSDDHLFEPWWGGVRAFAYIGPAMAAGDGAVRIVDADGCRRVRGTPRIGRHGRARRGTVRDPGRGTGRGGRHGSGGPAGAGAAAGRARRGSRRRSWRSTCCISTVARCCPSRSSSDARRCGGSCDRATRWSPCRPSPPRARRSSRRSRPRAWPGVLARQRMSPYFPGDPQPAVAVHPGGGRAGRAWRAASPMTARSPCRPRPWRRPRSSP